MTPCIFLVTLECSRQACNEEALKLRSDRWRRTCSVTNALLYKPTVMLINVSLV